MSANQIWKFALPNALNAVAMPPGANVLSAQMNNEIPCIWAICDAETKERETRMFCVFGTGEPLPVVPGLHIGTVQDHGYVWHIFEAPQ